MKTYVLQLEGYGNTAYLLFAVTRSGAVVLDETLSANEIIAGIIVSTQMPEPAMEPPSGAETYEECKAGYLTALFERGLLLNFKEFVFADNAGGDSDGR